MNSGRDNDRFTDSNIDWVTCKVSYDEHVDFITRQRLAEDGLADLIFVIKRTNFINEVALVRIRKRVAMCKKNRVIFIYNNKKL